MPILRGLVPSGSVGVSPATTTGGGWRVTVPESMKSPAESSGAVMSAMQRAMNPERTGILSEAPKNAPESGPAPHSVTETHGGAPASVEEMLGSDQPGAGDVVTAGTTEPSPVLSESKPQGVVPVGKPGSFAQRYAEGKVDWGGGDVSKVPQALKYDKRKRSFVKTMKQTEDEMNWESGLEPGTPEARSASSLHRDLGTMNNDYRRRIADEKGMISPDLLLGMALEEGLRRMIGNSTVRAAVRPAVKGITGALSAVTPSYDTIFRTANFGRYGNDPAEEGQ